MNKKSLIAIVIICVLFIRYENICAYSCNNDKNSVTGCNSSNQSMGGYVCIQSEKTIVNFSKKNTEDENYGMVEFINNESDINSIVNCHSKCINYSDGWIYFINTDSEFNEEKKVGKVCKVKNDGTDYAILNKDECKYVQIIEDEIYYINNDDKIYKMDIDGKVIGKICDDTVKNMIIENEIIYYSNNEDMGKVYKIDLNGKNKSKILDTETIYYIINDEYIYYLAYDYFIQGDIICRKKLDGNSEREVLVKTENRPRRFVVKGNYIYYNSWMNINYNVLDSRNEEDNEIILKQKIGEEKYIKVGEGFIKGIDDKFIYVIKNKFIYHEMLKYVL